MIYSLLWPCLGLLLVLFTFYDFYKTTLALNRGGALSRRLAGGTWTLLLRIHRRRNSHALLSAAGPAILLLLIVTWMSLCWLGWFLVFMGGEDWLVNSQTNASADLLERAYYTGYSITTIGYGDFKSTYPGIQFASVLAGLNGLFLLTIAVTYSLPVLSASLDRLQIALLISSLGSTTHEMVEEGHSQACSGALGARLESIGNILAGLAQKHWAYPVLHFFHSSSPSRSLPLNLFRLKEALGIISFAFPDLSPEIRAQLKTSHYIIDSFLETLSGNFVNADERVPPAPDCAAIGVLSVSPFSSEEIETFLMSRQERTSLFAYLLDDGWSWEEAEYGTSEGS